MGRSPEQASMPGTLRWPTMVLSASFLSLLLLFCHSDDDCLHHMHQHDLHTLSSPKSFSMSFQFSEVKGWNARLILIDVCATWYSYATSCRFQWQVTNYLFCCFFLWDNLSWGIANGSSFQSLANWSSVTPISAPEIFPRGQTSMLLLPMHVL